MSVCNVEQIGSSSVCCVSTKYQPNSQVRLRVGFPF